MSEEFETWINKTYPGRFCYHHRTAATHMLKGWRGCEQVMQSKIDEQENRIKAIIATQKTLLTTRFNEGLQLGLYESKRAIETVKSAKEHFLDENENLTNLLLEAEAKFDEQETIKKHWNDQANYWRDLANRLSIDNDALRKN